MDLVDKEEMEREIQEADNVGDRFRVVLIRADKLVINARQSTGLSVVRHATKELSQAKQNAIKLPKMDLPSFSDQSYTAWTSFWDLFNSSIHGNATLSDGQNLSYLKVSVTGELSRLVAALQVTDANHPVARKILTGRYENERSIVCAHIAALINYPTIKSESASSLWKLNVKSTNIFLLSKLGESLQPKMILLQLI